MGGLESGAAALVCPRGAVLAVWLHLGGTAAAEGLQCHHALATAIGLARRVAGAHQGGFFGFLPRAARRLFAAFLLCIP